MPINPIIEHNGGGLIPFSQSSANGTVNGRYARIGNIVVATGAVSFTSTVTSRYVPTGLPRPQLQIPIAVRDNQTGLLYHVWMTTNAELSLFASSQQVTVGNSLIFSSCYITSD